MIKSNSPRDIEHIPQDTEMLIFDSFSNNITWNDLRDLPTSIRVLYLGHDGVIYVGRDNKTKIINEVLDSLPNLHEIDHCGYYARDYATILEKCVEGRNIQIVELM